MAVVDVQPLVETLNGRTDSVCSPSPHTHNSENDRSVVVTQDATVVVSSRENGNIEDNGVLPKRNGLSTGIQQSLPCIEELGRLREDLVKAQADTDEKQCQLNNLEKRASLEKEVDRSRIRDLTSANEELKEQLRGVTAESEQRGRDLDSVRRKLVEELEFLRNQLKEKEASYEKDRREAEAERQRLAGQLAETEGQLSSIKGDHENTLKQAVEEREARVKELSQQCAEVSDDKSTLLEKLAQLEEERQDLNAEKMKAERSLQQMKKEAETHRSKVEALESDVVKWQTNYESVQALLNETQKDTGKRKDDLKAQSLKVSWATNKLKAETEAHKETRAKLQLAVTKLKEAQEEVKQAHEKCEKMVQEQKELTAQSSSDFDAQLKKRQLEFDQQEQELAEAQQAHSLTSQELERTRSKLKEASEQIAQFQSELEEKVDQCRQSEQAQSEMHSRVVALEEEKKSLETQLEELRLVQDSFVREQENVSSLSAQLSDESATRTELQSELAELQQKEGELLSFHQRLSSRNAELQAQHSHMSERVGEMTEETQTLRKERDRLLAERNTLSSELQKLQDASQNEISTLKGRLSDKTKAVEQLSVLLEDERGEVRVLKKKNQASIKDLTRQLLQARKTINAFENGEVDAEDLRQKRQNVQGKGGRSSGQLARFPSEPDLSTSSPSEVSLDSFRLSPPTFSPLLSPQQDSSLSPLNVAGGAGSEVAIAKPHSTLEKERRMMLSKIGSLQKAHASKDDKLEFLESHIQELTEEVRRKSKVVQTLLLRQDAGSVVPPSIDSYKMHRAPQKGIMASVFHSRRADQRMTLDLSIQINTKMQAVLEDLLLKNITLKDNLATLGEEVARLLAVLKQNGIHTPSRRTAS